MATLRRLDAAVKPRCQSQAPCRRPLTSLPCAQRTPDDWAMYTQQSDLDARAENFRRVQDRSKAARQPSPAAIEATRLAAAERRRLQEGEDMKRQLAEELEGWRQHQFREEAASRLSMDSHADLRRLRKDCQELQAQQRQALQVLRQELLEEQERLQEGVDLSVAEELRLRGAEASIREALRRKAIGARWRDELLQQAAAAKEAASELRRKEQEEGARLAEASAGRMRQQDEQAHARKRGQQQEVRSGLDRLVEQKQTQMELSKAEEQDRQAADTAARRRSDAILSGLADERRRIEEDRQAVLARVYGELERHNRQSAEDEALRSWLRQEEYEAQQRREKAAALQKRLEAKLEAAAVWQKSAQELTRKREAAAAEAETWRQAFMARMAEEDRLEQMNANRRRMKLQEHRRHADAQLEERRKRKEEEQEAEQQEAARKLEEEEGAARIVESEMRRLLQIHAGLLRQEPLQRFVVQKGFGLHRTLAEGSRRHGAGDDGCCRTPIPSKSSQSWLGSRQSDSDWRQAAHQATDRWKAAPSGDRRPFQPHLRRSASTSFIVIG
eukprot:TRINITY_DN34890_c0_g1_i1.p1 TRINITY_DN34890_c0_g1~~TRINITY_DN34890_c0_g1_i1.p1  ORF type:complete len:558 (-),score=163.24 TRINITY_DN34890_c0_g1_i1:167-1840(-)